MVRSAYCYWRGWSVLLLLDSSRSKFRSQHKTSVDVSEGKLDISPNAGSSGIAHQTYGEVVVRAPRVSVLRTAGANNNTSKWGGLLSSRCWCTQYVHRHSWSFVTVVGFCYRQVTIRKRSLGVVHFIIRMVSGKTIGVWVDTGSGHRKRHRARGVQILLPCDRMQWNRGVWVTLSDICKKELHIVKVDAKVSTNSQKAN